MAPGILDPNIDAKETLTTPATKNGLPAEIEKRNNTYEDLSRHGNPALFVTPDHSIALREDPIPTIEPHEVLIHVRATGICGSDLHLWHRGHIGTLNVSCDSILGHEAAGVVVAVGSAVKSLECGDRVAIEPGVPCDDCFLCKSGRYNLCEKVAFAGVCPHAGTIRRFMAHDSRYCHKLPLGVSFARAALLEPLSVVLHAISLCNGSLKIGQPALICGAGPIGLIALAAAKASGAWPLVITDMDESRLAFARNFVPGVQTYRVDVTKSSITSAEEIRSLLGCGERDIKTGRPASNEYVAPTTVLECTGVESSIITAIYACRRNGTVMVIGVGRSIINELPFMYMSLSEIQLKFTNRYVDTWPAGINALANEQVMDLDSLITHTFPLEKAVEAMQLSEDRSQAAIKVQIIDDAELGL